jgi:hypothetical protein
MQHGPGMKFATALYGRTSKDDAMPGTMRSNAFHALVEHR